MSNLYHLFSQTARRQPDHPAIFYPASEQSLTYRELDEAIALASERLRQSGLQPGHCVGLHHPSNADYIIQTYAVWRCGGCVVPIPVELTAAEKAEICECIALDWVLSPSKTTGFAAEFHRDEPQNGSGHSTASALFRIKSPARHPAGFHELDAAFIRFTSGTTGASKGVVLSHRTIEERIRAANVALQLTPDDRVLWVLSMSYHFTVSIVAYLTFGASIVLPANHFAQGIVSAICQHQASILYASPLHYSLLADYPAAGPLPSLRLAISTTSSLEERVARRFGERYGRPIAQALGIIELGLPCIHTDASSTRWASVGRVQPPFELKLADCGLGPASREVLLRGPGMLDAYYQPWRPRAEILSGGWFRTGDVGHLDADGYLYLAGRSKDVINVMGMKFFPHEVEQVLVAHPHVRAASVYSGRDPRWGERVQARVVAAAGAPVADLAPLLKRYCQERLASYKVPDDFEFVASLPKTASGKILHRAL